MTRRIAHAAQICAIVVALVLVPVALAAKGGGGGGGKAASATGSLSLKMVTDQNADNLPNWNDEITFVVSSSAAYPMVNLSCYQGSTLVKNQTVGFYPGWVWSKTYALSDWYTWTSGGADCTARLYYQSTKGEVTLATQTFRVND
jgi:hypothetical protein